MEGQSVEQARDAHGEWALEESSRLAAVVDADGDDVLFVPSYAACLRVDGIAALEAPCRLVAALVGGHAAGLADELAVEVAFVGVVGLGQVEDDELLLFGSLEQAARYGEVDAVPGVCVVDGIALVVPVLCHVDGLPIGIFCLGLSPVHVVSLVEKGLLDAYVLSGGGDGHPCCDGHK